MRWLSWLIPAFMAQVVIPPICKRGMWNTRMLIETVLSMLTTVCHLKHHQHWRADYFRARMVFVIAAFNVLVQWDGMHPDASGMVHLSIAEFSR
jgi:hypothetical protein